MMFTVEEPVLSGVVIAERLGVVRSTGYRYLQSLVGSRFLEEAPGGGFRLGLRVLEIARVARASFGLTDVAHPVMSALAQEVQETVLLTRRSGDLVVCVDSVEVLSRPARISYGRGAMLPVNAGASALVLLAWSPPDEARSVLERKQLDRFTPSTLTDVDALIARLADIRRDGYSITRAELDDDVLGIAAPIRDEHGSVRAAISVAALAGRVTTDHEAEVLVAVRAAAADIERRLMVIGA